MELPLQWLHSLSDATVSYTTKVVVEIHIAIDLASHVPTNPGPKHLYMVCL